jgi:hypothetical protein
MNAMYRKYLIFDKIFGTEGTENFSFRPIQGRKKIFHPIQGRKKNLPSHTRTENIFRLPSREYSWKKRESQIATFKTNN